MSASKIAKIGMLIVVASLMFIWGISYLKGINIFKKELTYYVVYKDVNGIIDGNEVLIGGYKIGQIMEIKFVPDTINKFVVKFMVDNEYKIRKGSVAEVFSKDLMGTRAIRILQSKDSLYHLDGDTLNSAVEGTLVEQVNMEIAPLKRKAESLISSLDSAIVVVRSIFNEKTQENLRKTFASLYVTVANLKHATFTIDTMLTSEKKKLARIFSNVESITGNLKDNNDKIAKVLTNFASISDSIAKADIASTLRKADTALLQFNEILTSINEGEGTVAQLLNNDTLYQNLENASYHLARLMRDMHENPKRYLHFSVFDVGKTIYVADPEDKRVKRMKKKQEKQKAKEEEEKTEEDKSDNGG
jgi:phospholipid/cholesterol/gamma-HCH transport system substrate-binding protein